MVAHYAIKHVTVMYVVAASLSTSDKLRPSSKARWYELNVTYSSRHPAASKLPRKVKMVQTMESGS